MSNDDLDSLLESAAAILSLPIDPTWRPSVRTNLETLLAMGALVEGLPLPDEAEPAGTFRA